jgi:hypothetical protein
MIRETIQSGLRHGSIYGQFFYGGPTRSDFVPLPLSRLGARSLTKYPDGCNIF